jgi:hypothetical protein
MVVLSLFFHRDICVNNSKIYIFFKTLDQFQSIPLAESMNNLQRTRLSCHSYELVPLPSHPPLPVNKLDFRESLHGPL